MDGIEHEVVAFVRAFVLGDHFCPAADDHLVYVALDQHVPVPVGHRDRVIIGAVPDQGQRTRPAGLLLASVIGRGGQWQQRIQVPLHALADGLGVAPEPRVPPFQAAAFQVGVQRIKALEGRNRHEEIAPHVSHHALHLPLVVALAGPAEPVLEQVVGLEFGECPGGLAVAIPQDPGHRQPGVVVEDALRHAPRKHPGGLVLS